MGRVHFSQVKIMGMVLFFQVLKRNLKMYKKVFLILAFGFQISATHFVGTRCSWALGPGSTGANFLKIGIGARPSGMGEAFVALADDASALSWNPAGLIQIEDKEIFFMHNFWVQGISQDFLGYVHGGHRYSFGAGLLLLNAGIMSRTMEDASGNYGGKNGTFTYTDFAFTGSFAQRTGSIGMGVNLKIARTLIDNVAGSAAGVDIGLLYLPEKIRDLKFAVVLQNFGSRMKYAGNVSDALPLSLRAGMSYVVGTEIGPMNLEMDVNVPVDNRIGIYLGMEYWIQELVAVRAGYKTDRMVDLGALSGLCCGLGFRLQNFQIDYAFVPYGNLGNTHRVSVLARF